MDPSRAPEDARQRWHERRVRRLVMGLLGFDGPTLFKDDVFYCASLGCRSSPEGEAYVQAYNETLDAVVREHGVPEWAPGGRRPPRDAALAHLQRDGGPCVWKDHTWWERRAIEEVVAWRRGRGMTTVLAAPLPARQVFLLAGDLNPRCGVVDIVDLAEKRHMSSYEYRRRHVPTFPWDGVASARLGPAGANIPFPLS